MAERRSFKQKKYKTTKVEHLFIYTLFSMEKIKGFAVHETCTFTLSRLD